MPGLYCTIAALARAPPLHYSELGFGRFGGRFGCCLSARFGREDALVPAQPGGLDLYSVKVCSPWQVRTERCALRGKSGRRQTDRQADR
jgi:hypothetical protein